MKPTGELSRYQFSIRSLLWTTLVAAILCAAAAPVLRGLSVDHWRIFAVSISIIVTGFFTPLMWLIWRFHDVERRAESLLFVTPQFRPKVIQSIAGSRAIAAPLSLIGFAVVVGIMLSTLGAAAPWLGFMFVMAIQYAQPVAVLLLPARFCALYRMHENGVVWAGVRFVPWSKVQIMRWRTDNGWLAWSLNGHYSSFDVSELDRKLVDEILQKYCPPNSLIAKSGMQVAENES